MSVAAYIVINMLTSVEVCAGAGGQALGLEIAGFDHAAVVEIDRDAAETLRTNRPSWKVYEEDLHDWDPSDYRGVDLVAGGVPCPPFSVAGSQLGADDERDLFPRTLEIVEEIGPRAVMIENVRGLFSPRFDAYRDQVIQRLQGLGYRVDWRVINSSDYGVPQLRPRSVLIALKDEEPIFGWPEPDASQSPTVGEVLYDLMGSRGWKGVDSWAAAANTIGPTLVGGSKKHGGPDLGPTRAREAWARLGVDGRGLANEAPEPDFSGMPRLTVEMAARIQGFPDSWKITGRKTASYRQVGNAFPPPVAAAVGKQLAAALAPALIKA